MLSTSQSVSSFSRSPIDNCDLTCERPLLVHPSLACKFISVKLISSERSALGYAAIPHRENMRPTRVSSAIQRITRGSRSERPLVKRPFGQVKAFLRAEENDRSPTWSIWLSVAGSFVPVSLSLSFLRHVTEAYYREITKNCSCFVTFPRAHRTAFAPRYSCRNCTGCAVNCFWWRLVTINSLPY